MGRADSNSGVLSARAFSIQSCVGMLHQNKRVAREEGLKDLVAALEGFACVDDHRYEQALDRCFYFLQNGSAKEKGRKDAYRAIGLYALTVGRKAEQTLLDSLFHLGRLATMVPSSPSDAERAVAAIDCVAAATIATAKQPWEAERTLKAIWEVIQQTATAAIPQVLAAAVSAWTVVLPAARYIEDDMAPFVLIAKLLRADDADVRMAGGEALTVCIELDILPRQPKYYWYNYYYSNTKPPEPEPDERPALERRVSELARPLFLSFPKSPAPPLAVPAKHHPSATASISVSSRPRAVSASSNATPPSPPSPPPPPTDGVGPAAPTRSDVYLGRQLAAAAAAGARVRAPEEDAEKRRRRKEKRKALAKKTPSGVACCYGCGAPLHTGEEGSPGYVEPATYDLKKRHNQLRTVLCGRCKLLSHGHMVTTVGGHGGYPGGKQFVTAEELREKLSYLRHEKALIVKLVDIVDFNGSFLGRIRDFAGANPIVLVITKVDLLPRDTDLNCVGDWVVESVVRKKLNVLSVHLTSSKSLVGITGVISEIQQEKKARDVYILGSANVGKSAFISAMLKTMAYKDPVAAAAQKYKPIQSAVPGTTLGPIQIEAFLGGGKLYDTPGVHLHHRQAAVIHADDLPSLAPQSRLKGRCFPANDTDVELSGNTLFWGGLVRIDVVKALPRTRLTFYGPKKLSINMVPTTEADEFYKKEVGVTLTPPTGQERAEGWCGLEGVRELKIKYDELDRPASDIAISGLGWIAVEPLGVPSSDPDGSAEEEEDVRGELHLTVHVPKPVEVFVRSPLPVGKAASQWYRYQELTEAEEELRPKWHY